MHRDRTIPSGRSGCRLSWSSLVGIVRRRLGRLLSSQARLGFTHPRLALGPVDPPQSLRPPLAASPPVSGGFRLLTE